ncbi:MAG: quinoprotein dehydrogenase-associated SoxYZ-like carrier [Methylotenera sp.]|nr:MAG: quinoprotein dehydrogenase-associated SoxYZ-like carrier [Methylotenera sp.]
MRCECNTLTKVLAAILLGLLINISQAAPIIDNWPIMQSAFFANRVVEEGVNQIIITAPVQAEDAALVPVTFELVDDNLQYKWMYVFIDANPIPLTATLHFPSNTHHFKLSTRVRLESNSILRVIAETRSGQLLMASVAIKTAGGGCGGGGLSDESALRASAGKMKFKQTADAMTGIKTVALNIKHPMRTGFERTAMGYYAKAWFINRLDLSVDNKPILNADLGPGISADPYFQFDFTTETGYINIEAKDNEGKLYQQTFALN